MRCPKKKQKNKNYWDNSTSLNIQINFNNFAQSTAPVHQRPTPFTLHQSPTPSPTSFPFVWLLRFKIFNFSFFFFIHFLLYIKCESFGFFASCLSLHKKKKKNLFCLLLSIIKIFNYSDKERKKEKKNSSFCRLMGNVKGGKSFFYFCLPWANVITSVWSVAEV